MLQNNQGNIDLWPNDIDKVEDLVTDNRDDIKILKENFNNLKEEVKKLKTETISNNNTDD